MHPVCGSPITIINFGFPFPFIQDSRSVSFFPHRSLNAYLLLIDGLSNKDGNKVIGDYVEVNEPCVLCAVSPMPTRHFWDAHNDLDQPHALCKQQFVGQFGFSARANKSIFFSAVQ